MIDFQRLFHTGIRVTDLDKAMAELTNALGVAWARPREGEQPVWTPETGLRSVPLRFTYSTEGPQHLELLEGAPRSIWDADGTPGVHHVGVWVDDVVAETDGLLRARLDPRGRATGARLRARPLHVRRAAEWLDPRIGRRCDRAVVPSLVERPERMSKGGTVDDVDVMPAATRGFPRRGRAGCNRHLGVELRTHDRRLQPSDGSVRTEIATRRQGGAAPGRLSCRSATGSGGVSDRSPHRVGCARAPLGRRHGAGAGALLVLRRAPPRFPGDPHGLHSEHDAAQLPQRRGRPRCRLACGWPRSRRPSTPSTPRASRRRSSHPGDSDYIPRRSDRRLGDRGASASRVRPVPSLRRCVAQCPSAAAGSAHPHPRRLPERQRGRAA